MHLHVKLHIYWTLWVTFFRKLWNVFWAFKKTTSIQFITGKFMDEFRLVIKSHFYSTSLIWGLPQCPLGVKDNDLNNEQASNNMMGNFGRPSHPPINNLKSISTRSSWAYLHALHKAFVFSFATWITSGGEFANIYNDIIVRIIFDVIHLYKRWCNCFTFTTNMNIIFMVF